MPYSIFVSHAGCDRGVAEALTRRINNAFRGTVDTYLAVRDLKPGDHWKRELRSKLRECDAILSIITQQSQSRPWILIEWGAFWLQDKSSYVCLDSEVEISDLVHPMQDRQIARLRDDVSMRAFFEALAADAGCNEIPYAHVEPLTSEVRTLLTQQEEERRVNSLSRYADASEELPQEAEKLREIALHFLDCGDAQTFVRVALEIRDELRLTELCRIAVSKGEVRSAFLVSERVRSAERLFEVYASIIDRGPDEHALILPLLDDLGRKSQTEVQRLAIRLIERGEEESALFRAMIEGMTNMAELRKVGIFLVANGRFWGAPLQQVVDMLGAMNRAELRKVGSEFIRHGLTGVPEFQRLRQILYEQNKKEWQKLENELLASA